MHRPNILVEIEAVEKQTKEVQIVPSRAIGNSTMTRKKYDSEQSYTKTTEIWGDFSKSASY